MDRQQIIEILRSRQKELQAGGIIHLRIFGSVARGEASPASDIDLLADFDQSKRLTLIEIGSLQSLLTRILGVDVDLSSSDWLREPVRSRANHEAILAF